MKEPIDISFKALNSGVGFSSSAPKSFSYYEKSSTELALDSEDIFENLLESPEFYDQLEKRLETPVLESLSPQKTYFKTKSALQEDKQELSQRESQDQLNFPRSASKFVQEIESPLNTLFIPPFLVLKVDIAFTLGLYMLGGVLSAAAFGIQNTPSWIFLLLGYGIFHQLYLVICRSVMGCSLGEERCNISWNIKTPIYFILRGLLSIFTGFVFLPLLSIIFRKDLLEDCTGLHLEYNI